MRYRRALRWVGLGMGTLVGVMLLFLLAVSASWVYRGGLPAGLTAMGRLLKNGPTKIDDFKVYPGRLLQASSSPYHFNESRAGWLLAEFVEVGEEEFHDLQELLPGSDTIAFLILKKDELVYESYYQGHAAEALSQAFSVNKSITSALVGAAIADGYITAVEQPVTDYVPELIGRGFEGVTLEHLLTMTSGSGYVENDNPFGVHVLFNYTPDLEKMILDFRVVDEPGRVFLYKSGDTALASLALERALSPLTISEYMQQRLWEPLGMEYEGVWTVDQEGGLEKTWCCLAATARDFAKLGRLYLRSGDWEGQQLLPAEWVERSTQHGGVAKEVWGEDWQAVGFWNYGYGWWLASPEMGDYLALGKDGQYIYVNPLHETVIVRLGWSQGGLPTSRWLRLFQYLAVEVMTEP
jgi:CubicO group peptidase (beta-lactamase class C family)